MTWFLSWGRKRLDLSGWIEIDLVSAGDRCCLDFNVGFGIDLFFSGGRERLVFSVLIAIDLVLASRSKFVRFRCGIGVDLGFRVGVENYLVLVCGSILTWCVWEIEVELISSV